MEPQTQAPDRNLAMELARVTEAAALAAGRWLGKGDKNAADGAAVDAMRIILNSVSMEGIVVIGQGDTRAPMRASLAGNAVNIALDAVLILGLGWGVRGAAVATICGNLTELALLAWPMRSALRGLVLRRSAIREVWAQGLPNGAQFVMEVGAFLILTVLVASMSAVDGAAHQMVLHLVNVSFLPAHALAEAASVLVGQAVGANRDA